MAKSATRPNHIQTTAAPKQKVSVKIHPVGLVILAMLLLGIAGFLIYRASTRGNVAPVAAIEATKASSKVLVQESFESLERWMFKPSVGKDYKIALQNGEMVLDVSGTALHNYISGEYATFSAETNAKVLDGSDMTNSRYGLVFKRTSDSAYYFEYYPYQNGLWTLQLGQNDKFTQLGKGNTSASAIQPPKSNTKLRVDVTGTKAQLFINGLKVGEADVSAIPRGQIGVSATSDKGKNIRMAFSNFVISEQP